MFSPKELSSKGQDLHELKAAVSLARTAKILGAREEHIVLSAASFTVRQVKDIVIPIQDVSMIYAGNSLTDALLKAHRDMHTRFPVCTKEGDPQTIEGYINFKDIITVLKINPQNPSLSQIVRPIKKVSEDMVISQLLEVMIQEKIHIVLVVSLKEKVLGIVTLEDIIEELTGDIESEFDRLPTYIHPCGTASWIMGGGVPMTLVASTLGLNWEGKLIAKAEPVPETKAAAAGVNVPKVPTLNEWCKHKAHKKLIGGEIIEVEGLRIVPRKFRRKKLYEAAVSLALVSDKG
jgi:putative hemolysin